MCCLFCCFITHRWHGCVLWKHTSGPLSSRHCLHVRALHHDRYNVQEKLVDFMAPVMSEPPQFASQLFASLFGHEGR